MTKMRCQQMDRRTNGTVKAPPFYLQQHCHFRPPFVRRHPHLLCPISYIFVISAATGRAKSCKLMATGAHSKRFHYCHKLRRQLRLRRRRLREIALKNFPAVLFDFRYVIFKWLPKRAPAPPPLEEATKCAGNFSADVRWFHPWTSAARITIPCKEL